MNHYVRIALVLCACVALTTAQYHFGDYGEYPTNFQSIGNYPTYSAGSARDPRANTGPVLFPMSPASAAGTDQSSGVVPGASGYGFVPPGSSGPVLHSLYVASTAIVGQGRGAGYGLEPPRVPQIFTTANE